IAELRSCRPSASGKKAKGPAIAEAPESADEEPRSVYTFVDSTESERTTRPEAASTVFVRSRGSSVDRYEGSRIVRRRWRRRLFLRLILLIAAVAAGWYFISR